MSDYKKVLFVQSMGEDEYEIESLWCTQDGDNYVIDNIPFVAKNISSGDVIKVEYVEEENAYYFEEIVEPSGNSTIRVLVDDVELITSIRESLSSLGCESEAFLSRKLIAVNVPKDIDYRPIRTFLDKGEQDNKWEYQESCLAHEY